MYLVTPRQSRPSYSPLPFENKLYFQENLTKYLREKYPKLNVNAMKVGTFVLAYHTFSFRHYRRQKRVNSAPPEAAYTHSS